MGGLQGPQPHLPPSRKHRRRAAKLGSCVYSEEANMLKKKKSSWDNRGAGDRVFGGRGSGVGEGGGQ